MSPPPPPPPSPPPAPPPRERVSLWREGGAPRVLTGAAAAFAGGASYMYFARSGTAASPVAPALRAGAACALLAAPFFAVREVVAASMRVDGPVASAVSGGVAGYFGALFTLGPYWKAVSRSAMLTGVGCGVVDALVSALDWKRKLYLLRRHDQAVAAAAAAAADKMHGAVVDDAHAPLFSWPHWLPVLTRIDHEYEELLNRQRATVLALQREQARIALLLRALESVKAGNRVTDVELAEATSSSSLSSSSLSSSSLSSPSPSLCDKRPSPTP